MVDKTFEEALHRKFGFSLIVAVTSCSAERVMSRVKIIKNRLRSTMDDDWFSALTVLASERDILENFSASTIIDSFALCSPKLQNILGVHAGHSDSAYLKLGLHCYCCKTLAYVTVFKFEKHCVWVIVLIRILVLL